MDALLKVATPTGISSVEGSGMNGTTLYDLSGRKAKGGHGVFIQNGKKVVR